MTKIAYLTIDDAPSQDFLNKLDFLDEQGIQAVWFCQGNYMEQRPQMIVEAIQRGHVIGNHAYSHPHFSDLSLDQCYAEIRATDAVIDTLYQQAGVARPARYFRFPYGDKGDLLRNNVEAERSIEGQQRHSAIQSYLRNLGYTQPEFPDITYNYYRQHGLLDDADWLWTYDTHDWAPLYGENAAHGIDCLEEVYARMEEDEPEAWRGLNYPDSADIVLVHDYELPRSLFFAEMQRMIDKGIKFVPPPIES